jgi:DNA polymerase beta
MDILTIVIGGKGPIRNHMSTKRDRGDESPIQNKKKGKPMDLSNFVLKTNHNQKITAILEQLGEIEWNRGEKFKSKAYRRAKNSLEHLDHEVLSGEEAKHLEGVGEKIAKKIDEIIESGKLNKLVSELADPVVVSTNDLCRISGIGPAYAKKLVEQGVKSIQDLKDKNIKLNNHQQIGLKYLEDFEQRIPRDEMMIFEKLIKESIWRLDGNIEVMLSGSFRRERPTSGDIDVLITQTKSSSISADDYTIIDHVVKHLTKDGLIKETMSMGNKKFMGVTQLPKNIKEFEPHLNRRIDIMFICHDQYYCGLLHATGSDFFNAQVRSYAIERGFRLSEYSLTKNLDPEPMKVTCEKDVFDYLGIPFLIPKDRNL